MNEIKKLTKSTVIYFFGTVGTKLVSFLLLPLYTSYISPENYGTYDLNITYSLLFASFFFLDIWTGIMKFIFEKKEQREKTEVVYNGIAIFLTSAMLYLFVMGGVGVVLKLEYLPGVMSYGFFLCFQSLYGYLARSFGHNLRFAVSGMLSTACTAILNIIFLVYMRMDYHALYLSYALGILLQCAVLEYKLHIIPAFRFDYLNAACRKELLRFSLPLCVNSLCYWFLTGYNRVMISKHLDAAANGYFAVASKFGGILIIVSSCFTMAWQELAYRKFNKDEETGKFYSHATDLYIKALFCGFLVLIPVIYVIFPLLVDEGYEASKNLIPMSMMATLSGILFTFLGNIISTYKKNEVIFISTFFAGAVNIGCLYLLIGRCGAEAANLSLLAGYLVSDGIRVFMIGREVPYRIHYKMFLYLIPLAGVTFYAYREFGLIGNIGMGIIGCMVTLVLFRDMLGKTVQAMRKRR